MVVTSESQRSRLNVWFKDDIQNALSAIDSANADLFQTINTPEMQLYRRGYEAALRAMAEAFGLRYDTANCLRQDLADIIDVTPR